MAKPILVMCCAVALFVGCTKQQAATAVNVAVSAADLLCLATTSLADEALAIQACGLVEFAATPQGQQLIDSIFADKAYAKLYAQDQMKRGPK